MKKFFALVLALVMALSLATVAWGAAPTPVSDETELKAALAAGEDVIFENDIEVAATADSHNIATMTGIFVPAGVTVDGNGYMLTVTGAGDETVNNTNSAIKSIDGITVKNLIIVGGSRGIYVAGAFAVDGSMEKSTVFENLVILNSCRGYNVSGTCKAGVTLTVSNCTLAGQCASSGALASTNFVNCTFVTNGSAKGDFVEPKGGDVNFDNCVFTAGYEVGFEDFTTGSTMDFVDCIYDGEPLTADNMDDLFDSFYDPAVDVAAATATPGANVTFHAADGSTDGWYLLDIFVGVDLDDFVADDDNFLPCYEVPGYGYFTEVKAAAGAYKLVYGAKTVYLAPVDYTKVHFDAKASVLNVVDADDAECGDWFVTNLDEDDVYYAVYDKKTGMVDEVYVAEKNGPVQLLVNGKIVDVDYLNYGTDIEWMLHDYKGYDVVNYQYTTVKCSECGKVAKLYANATAATVGKKEPVKLENGLGWVTAADFFGFGASASAGAPSTDKVVQSAQTFDAGIAMYVGMSVMAAAGSAVVIGKKKD